MKAQILDTESLCAISPAALAAYARGEGWTKIDAYGRHADIYIAEDRPEILLPRTDRLVDYASVVSRLMGIFGEVTQQDELTIYRDLVGADYDVVRVRMIGRQNGDSVLLDEGVELVSQAREMLLAAACATTMPQPVYRAGANRKAIEYMKRVRLGQTEHGSFAVKLMAPVPPTLQTLSNEAWARFDDEPHERQVTRRLVQALEASRDAAELAHSGDGTPAFESAVARGVSANLCKALARLTGQSDRLEVSVNWAKTRPTPESRRCISFSESDAGAFNEAARALRAKKPEPDVILFGTVHRLKRDEHNIDGQVTFKVDINGRGQSVSSVLDQSNYSVAIHAHEARNPVIVTGDLDRVGQRWHVTNASVREVTGDGGDEDDAG